MIDPTHEAAQTLLDQASSGRLGRRGFLTIAGAAGLAAALDGGQVERALAAGQTQVENRRAIKKAYDYIVVGAGAAGCILAAKLSQAGHEVLLVEAGGADTSPQVTTPGLWFTNIGGPLDWNIKARPSRFVNGRSVPVATGHVLGGGTSINAMLWVRGLAQDFDDWAYNGCDGWDFDSVLPVYKALEDWEGGANAWRGAGGPVHVRTSASPHVTAKAFIEAAGQMGVPILEDVNAPMREGAGYVNMSINKDGSRASAARAFLRPALDAPNLTLLLDSQAAQLLVQGTRCTGVKIRTGETVREVAANKEVIVTAGGMASAKLLMLSGIGRAEDLRALGLTPVVDLPGVGENFQDHPLLFGVVFGYKGAMPPRALDSNAVEAAAYVRSDAAKRGPDLKMVLMQLPVMTPEIQAKYGAPPPDAFTISPALVRPSSRGRLKLASADWRDQALLDAGFLSTDQDLRATVRCIEMCRELGHQAGYDAVRQAELAPGRALSKAELADFARNAAISFGHPVGTCKMGVDDMAVVDPQLRVRGVEGLRVCDSSIMPTIITGPTNAATQMIAAKAAQMILAG